MDLNENIILPLDPKDVPESVEPPLGIIEWAVEGIALGRTRPAQDPTKVGNKVMVTASLRAVAPEEIAGFSTRKDFYFGTNKDPDAKERVTYMTNPSIVQFFNMLRAAEVHASANLSETVLAAKGQHFLGEVKVRQGNNGFPNRNEITGFYKVGTKQVKLADSSSAQQAGYTNGQTSAFSAQD